MKAVDIFNKLTDIKREYPYISLKSYCKKMDENYKVLSAPRIVEELRPCTKSGRQIPIVINHILPESYIAEINNALVIGGNDIIIGGKYVISDVLAHKFADRMVLEKKIIKKVDLDDKKVMLHFHCRRKKAIKRAFYLIGLFSENYYHFLLDIIPRLYYLKQCEEYKNIPLVLDKDTYIKYKNIIEVFNEDKHPIVCVGGNTAYMVKKLVISSQCTWYDKFVKEEYYKDIGHVYDNFALKYIRELALSKIEKDDERKRIFISRRNLSDERKRLINESEIETIFRKFGFISVCPEELNFLEQVRLFGQTEIFAGATGAAFTNILFLPENATVIYATCVCGNTGENLFPSMWHAVGSGRFITLKGTVTEETRRLKDNLRKFMLNPKEVEDVLHLLCE